MSGQSRSFRLAKANHQKVSVAKADRIYNSLIRESERISAVNAYKPLPSGTSAVIAERAHERSIPQLNLILGNGVGSRERVIQLILINLQSLNDLQLYSAYLSLFCNLKPGLDEILIRDLQSMEYEVVKTTFEEDTEEALLFGLITTEWGLDHILIEPELEKRDQDIALSTLSLLISKDLTPANHREWTVRRLKAFTAEYGKTGCAWNEGYMPSQPECSALHAKLSMYPIRSHLFHTIRNIAATGVGLGQLFGTAIHLMRWTNMTHVSLIDEYIVKQNPVLMAWSPLHKKLHKLLQAYELLDTLEEENIPFARMIMRHDEAMPLHRDQLALYTAVAMKFAIDDHPTLGKYNGVLTTGYYQEVATTAYNLMKGAIVRSSLGQRALVSAAMGEHEDEVLAYFSNSMTQLTPEIDAEDPERELEVEN